MISIKFLSRYNPVITCNILCKANLHRTISFSRKSKTHFNILKRDFSCTNVLNDKIYTEYENAHAYNEMKKNLAKYSLSDFANSNENILPRENLDAMLCENWSQKNCDELAKSFNALSNLAEKEKLDISLSSFDNYVDALSDKLHDMSDQQLEAICVDLKKWPQTESVTTRNFIEIWAALDDVFKSRLNKWNLDNILLFIDHLYKLNLTRKAEYVREALSKVSGRFVHLTNQQLVQVMFFICTSRRAPEKILNLERKLNECIEKLSINELSIICLGFFKSNTTIKDKNIVNKVIRRVTAEANHINEITLCSMLKLIRHSSNRSQSIALSALLDKLTPQIARLSMPTCVQIAIVGTPMKYFHVDSLNAVADRFTQNASAARLKDLERIAFAFSHFNVTNASVYNTIVDELRNPEREAEIVKYSRCFNVCLSYLVKANVFPYDLLSRCLDVEAIKRVYPTLPAYLPKVDNEYGRELMLLDGTIEIECDGYNGNRLDKRIINKLAKRFTDYVPDNTGKYQLNGSQRLMLDIMKTLEKIRGGKEYVRGQHILPQFQKPDIVICDDENGRPVNVDDYFLPNQYSTIQRLPDANHNWYVMFVLKLVNFTCNTGELVGSTNMKLRQLKKLGYKPKMILWEAWIRLKTDDEKFEYLNSIMSSEDMNVNQILLSRY